MIFEELSFHDARILEVREETATQTFDLLLNFPVDWQNNVFAKKILRFHNTIFYIKKEIPFAGHPTILEVKILHSNKHTYSFVNGVTESAKHKIELVTNAGSRFIEFDEVELLGT